MHHIPILSRRRLQAEVIQPIYDEMVKRLGEDEAQAILDTAIRQAAIAEGANLASQAPNGETSMKSFIDCFELWTRGGALEVEVHQATDERFEFDVTRCRYSETYQEMGLGHIGQLLSCNRDECFCEGYDPKIKLERKQTIMAGDARCTFRYRYESENN